MPRPFPRAALSKISATKYFRVRAGDDHKFIAVWVVVVDGRVLVRSWNDRPGGWYRAFLEVKRGAIMVGDEEVPVRARPLRAKAILDAMDDGYAAKYTTKPNIPYVKGFATPKRRAHTLELSPA